MLDIHIRYQCATAYTNGNVINLLLVHFEIFQGIYIVGNEFFDLYASPAFQTQAFIFHL